METGTNQWEHNFQQQSSKMTTTKYQVGTAGAAEDQRLLQTLPWWTEQICWTAPAPHSKNDGWSTCVLRRQHKLQQKGP